MPKPHQPLVLGHGPHSVQRQAGSQRFPAHQLPVGAHPFTSAAPSTTLRPPSFSGGLSSTNPRMDHSLSNTRLLMSTGVTADQLGMDARQQQQQQQQQQQVGMQPGMRGGSGPHMLRSMTATHPRGQGGDVMASMQGPYGGVHMGTPQSQMMMRGGSHTSPVTTQMGHQAQLPPPQEYEGEGAGRPSGAAWMNYLTPPIRPDAGMIGYHTHSISSMLAGGGQEMNGGAATQGQHQHPSNSFQYGSPGVDHPQSSPSQSMQLVSMVQQGAGGMGGIQDEVFETPDPEDSQMRLDHGNPDPSVTHRVLTPPFRNTSGNTPGSGMRYAGPHRVELILPSIVSDVIAPLPRDPNEDEKAAKEEAQMQEVEEEEAVASEFLYTEFSLKGIVSPDNVDALLNAIRGVMDTEVYSLWKDECWRISTKGADSLNLLSSSEADGGELWVRKYAFPLHFRGYYCVRMFSPEHQAVSSDCSTNASRVRESLVSPSFLGMMRALGFRRSKQNDSYVKSRVFHVNSGTPEHVMAIVEAHYKDRKMSRSVLENQKYLVHLKARSRTADVSAKPIAQRLFGIASLLEPHVYMMKA
eukprot:GHVO01009524.1.p1 GENE.GHVO01009524.1~~GHVO01009524.1.p1  ORF type:complete len:615 (+),score=114.20 GHVO01009524.1:106-1845(+)